MSDPISWGLLASIKKLVKSVKTSVDNIDLSPVTGAVEDIATDLGQNMDELVANVGAEVDEMKEAVENAPVGMAPPPIGVFSAKSVDEGISCTYNMDDTQNNNDTHYQRAKGIMVRYSTEGYPQSEKDGVLGFIDEDIHDAETLKSKSKTSIITGLTNGKKYYLSAFTYSFYNVFQHNIGFGNYGKPGGRLTCSYTGNKGTLTVTVTQDYDYKTLGEFTATLTPSSGSAKTQTRTGPGQVVFAGLDAGTYTLSFSAETYFTTPASQQIVITAGQPNTTSAEYKTVVGLSNYTWDEIHEITVNGDASHFFSVGEKKQTTVKNVHGTFYTDDGFIASGSYNNTETCYAYLVDINYHEKIGSSNANSLLFMVEKASVFINTATNGLYWLSDEDNGFNASRDGVLYNTMRTWLNDNYNEIFPEIYSHICKVRNYATFYYSETSQTYVSETEDYIFPPSQKNLNRVATLPREETSYEYFKASTQTKLLDFVKNDLMIMTRSSYAESGGPNFIYVKPDGASSYCNKDDYPTHGSPPDYGFVLCFAIG